MEPVLYEKDGKIARVTLNRPEAMNSLNPPLIEGLHDAVQRVTEDEEIRVMCITGNERAFSAGADLKYIRGALDDLPTWYRYLHRLKAVQAEMEAAPVPIVAKVRGYALAGGLELLMTCDLAIAADDATIADQHANYGLMAGAGGTQRIIRRIGYQQAMELLLTGKWLTGKEAAAVGLVLRSVPGDKLDEEVEALLQNLAEKPRGCLKYTKRAVIRGADLPLDYALDQELFALAEYFTSNPQPKSGTDAFIGKTKAEF